MRVAVLLLAVASCAPRGPIALSPTQLHSRASRSIPAAFDEVYDAAWLTLEAAGWKVAVSDRRAGTASTDTVLASNGTGRAWDLSVSLEGATTVVTLLPRVFLNEKEVTAQMHWTLEGPGGEAERWETLFAGIAALPDAWKVHPELVLSNSRGELDAVGLRLLVPSWQHFAFSVDRRTLVMQDIGASPVPTLLYRIERRRPNPDMPALVHETLEHAFHAEGRTTEPEQWELKSDAWGKAAVGAALVGADLTPKPVRWRQWEAGTPAWVVRVVSACPPEGESEARGPNGTSLQFTRTTGRADCDGDIRRVIESAVNTAPVPGIRAR